MNYEEVYGEMHKNQKHFPGYSIGDHVKDIIPLVQDAQASNGGKPVRLLDYGCGKGYQYTAKRTHERWGGWLPYCYDPGVPHFQTMPEGRFHGVICTDVLEHVEKADVPAVLRSIFSKVDEFGFVYLGIDTKPSYRKKLPDGRPVHLTVAPKSWWEAQLAEIARPATVLLCTVYDR